MKDKYGIDGAMTLVSWRAFVVTAFVATNVNIAALVSSSELVDFVAVLFTAISFVSLTIHVDDYLRKEDYR